MAGQWRVKGKRPRVKKTKPKASDELAIAGRSWPERGARVDTRDVKMGNACLENRTKPHQKMGRSRRASFKGLRRLSAPYFCLAKIFTEAFTRERERGRPQSVAA
jgi:hypothetical protein